MAGAFAPAKTLRRRIHVYSQGGQTSRPQIVENLVGRMTGAGDSGGFGYLATVIARGPMNMPPEASAGPSRQPVDADHTVGGVDNQNGAVAFHRDPEGVGELASMRHCRRKVLPSYRYRPEPQQTPSRVNELASDQDVAVGLGRDAGVLGA
jgi:hypothetical protein